MKLTSILYYRHPKYYYYASNFYWGRPKYKENFHKKWKFEIGIHRKLPVEDYVTERKFEIPPGYVIKNPEDYMESIKEKYDFKPLPKERPWPFNLRPISGSTQDINYKEKTELMFNRKTKLLEGYKGALSFTNTILESEEALPSKITKNEDKLNLDKEILEMLSRRLEWSDKLDSNLVRINLKWEFPRLNKWTTPKYGASLDRKEVNVTASYQDCSDLLIAKQFGYFHYPKIVSPKYELAFKRNNNRCILDLRCDFITLQQNPSINELLLDDQINASDSNSSTKDLNEYLKNDAYLFDSNFKETTKNKELINISPINWEINFDKKHFYPTDEQLNRRTPITDQNVDIVFLGNQFNLFKFTPDRIIKGKLLLFLYGYAVGRARFLYGNSLDFEDELNYKVLDKPVIIKGVYINYSKRNLGFACYQLNTLSFDSEIKNQVWFDGPYDVINDQELILKKLALMNLNSYEQLNLKI